MQRATTCSTVAIRVVATILCCLLADGAYAAECLQSVARLVSLQGTAQVQVSGTGTWVAAAPDASFCPGDMLRVNAGGRAAVVLANESVIRVGGQSTLSFLEPREQQPLLIELLQGMLHIFSHRPRALQVNTPFVNGAVEGTEFLVEVDSDRATITVFNGLVAAANPLGQLNVGGGQAIEARAGMPPQYQSVVKGRDAVDWTLYYPEIVDPSSLLGQSSETAGLLKQSQQLISVGQIAGAQSLLAEVLDLDPANAEALAMQSIIALVTGRRDQARELAAQAVAGSPGSAAGLLALSYVEQADFDLDAAVGSLEEATKSNPGNAQVQARLSEMLLAQGDQEGALTAARQAVALNPELGRTQTVLGFAHLSRMEIDAAVAAFTRAMELDQALPLARLGLGLANIRRGDLAAGRSELEIAAALDPGSSLLRSYLGKAYYEEKRDAKAERQYSIAKTLDPADPTPWFYDALRKQSLNRPVEALEDLQQSIALNDNRAVYRSRLLLDEDLAVRSASLGRIYSDLGFQQLALREGWKSVNIDPTNYSAHRFLADSYGILPRHQVARVSELLQSQLLQPLNVNPVQPQLAENNLFFLDGAGPSVASLNEYNPLFLRNRLALQASAVGGSNNTFGDELVQSGVWNSFSYSLGQYYYQNDGFRDNNDQTQQLYNAYFQGMLSPQTSILTEFRYKKLNYGDLVVGFYPELYNEQLRQEDLARTARVGMRHDFSTTSSVIGTVMFSDYDGEATGFYGTDIFAESDGYMGEVQHLLRLAKVQFISGVGYYSADELTTLINSWPFTYSMVEDTDTTHTNVYSYATMQLPANIFATAGLAGDFLDSPVKDLDAVSPKFGLSWQVLPQTSVRAAAFRKVQRLLLGSQTIEPTQVAGFNQLIEDYEATESWNYGIGLDQRFTDSWFAGIQYLQRDLSVPYATINEVFELVVRDDDWQEDTVSAYLNWIPGQWVALSVDYFYEELSRDAYTGGGTMSDLQTHRIVPGVSFFHPSGFMARLQASYIDQQGEFSSPLGLSEDSDAFWVIDASIGYRLPDRMGMVSLQVRNLFDEQFDYLNTDPFNPKYVPEQQIFCTVSLTF